MDQVISPLKCVHFGALCTCYRKPGPKNNQFKMTVFSIVFVVIGFYISRGGHLGLIEHPY